MRKNYKKIVFYDIMMAMNLPRGVYMEWEEHFDNGVDMVAGAKARIEGEDKPIRYINGRDKPAALFFTH